MKLLDFALANLGLVKHKPADHKLKWKIPEGRFTSPIEDADAMVSTLEKKIRAKFISGGQYSEVVHAKQFGDAVFAYMFVRTDKRTEEETLVADGYMIQEEDIRLGLDVANAFKMEENLQSMGYEQVFSREFKVWKFAYFQCGVTVYDIEGFGKFVEVAIPATNFEKARERDLKKSIELFDKIGVKKDEIIPTDVTTLQLSEMAQQQAPGK